MPTTSLGAIAGGGVPTLRLGVTGLSRAGKTVFITALVHNLVHGGRLPLFDVYQSGRLAEARLKPQPDDEVPRFDYEAHVRHLVERRVWPESTRRISELRIVIEYKSAQLPETAARPRAPQSRHRGLSRRVAARPGAAAKELRRVVGRGDWRCRASRIARGVASGWHVALAGVDPSGARGRGDGTPARRRLHRISSRGTRRRARALHAAARPLPHAGRHGGLPCPHLRAARHPPLTSAPVRAHSRR